MTFLVQDKTFASFFKSTNPKKYSISEAKAIINTLDVTIMLFAAFLCLLMLFTTKQETLEPVDAFPHKAEYIFTNKKKM